MKQFRQGNYMKKPRWLLVCITAVLAPLGCESGGPQTISGNNAQPVYESTVSPLLARCEGGPCHSGAADEAPTKFCGDGGGCSYASVISFPVIDNFGRNPSLISRVSSEHFGTSFNEEEKQKILAWLSAEREARGGVVDVPTIASPAFQRFFDCMTMEEWDLHDMGDWSAKDTNSNNGDDTCATCHSDFQFGFHTPRINQEMFDDHKDNINLAGYSFIIEDVNPLSGTSTIRPAHAKLMRMATGAQPRFSYDVADANRIDLDNWVEAVNRRIEEDDCP